MKHKDGEEVVDEAGDVPMHVLRYRRLAGQQQEKDTKDHPADIEVCTQSTLADARIRTKLCPKRADAIHEAVEMVAQQRQKAETLVLGG